MMRLVLEDGSLLEWSEEGVYFQGGITIDENEGDELRKTGIVIREPALWFAAQMELKLRENDHKQHWNQTTMYYLLDRLKQEYFELEEAVHRYMQDPIEDNAREVIKEAADTGNFSMMIADNLSERPFKQVHRTWDAMREEERKKYANEQTDPGRPGYWNIND